LAKARTGSSEIRVSCGPGVELREDWFCEAAWDAQFIEGDFDQTDNVAGSGGRLRDGEIVFVSSSSLQDRLNYAKFGNDIFVSNSLSAIFAATGARVDPTTDEYRSILGSVTLGLDAYNDRIPTSMGDVRLLYYENLAWNGAKLVVKNKPRIERDFSTFDAYYQFMQSTMNVVVANAQSPDRTVAIEPLVSLSTGYDSPTVAVWAAKAGVRNAVTFLSDRDGKDDSGRRIGEKLGFSVDVVDRDHWRSGDYPEVDCIAGSGAAGEVAFASMGERLNGKLLLSGFWGGAVWNYGRKDERPVFSGHDGSGLSLTELRLRMGFVNCCAPYWGGIQVGDIAKISQSDDLAPWRVPSVYNRPICRRVVESEGVPREWFGQSKHGASDQLLTAANFLTDKSASDFWHWLTDNDEQWRGSAHRPPSIRAGKTIDYAIVNFLTPLVRRLVIPTFRRITRLPGFRSQGTQLGRFRRSFNEFLQKPLHYRRYVYPWALEKSAAKYQLMEGE
jgi:hypothetical protein